MFKGVIDDRPWGATGLNSASWLFVPVVLVDTRVLIMTQPGVKFEHLIEPTQPYGGDDYAHVVRWHGDWYLEDGHHRVIRAMLWGDRFVKARLWEM